MSVGRRTCGGKPILLRERPPGSGNRVAAQQIAFYDSDLRAMSGAAIPTRLCRMSACSADHSAYSSEDCIVETVVTKTYVPERDDSLP